MTAKTTFYRRTLPKVCIDFSSTHGKEIFKDALDAGYMNAYFMLGPQLRTQDEPAYCGLSSLVMVLNALAVDPGKVWKGVWRWYHEDMLECCTSLEEIKVHGLHMQQLSCIAKCNQLNSVLVFANENLSLDALRKTIKEASQSTEVALIASFGRKILGQTGSGHFAPVGGYSPKEDLVLLLEPARFKYPPFWITVTLLLEAMQSVDHTTGKPRGYLLLSKRRSQPTLLFRVTRSLNVFRPVDEDFVNFMNETLNFLKKKTPSQARINAVILDVSLRLSDFASLYKDSGTSLFFNTAAQSDIDLLSPEHQVAVGLLVETIEKTEIYQLIVEQISNCREPNQKQHKLKNELCRIDCGSTTCVLCFPHYLTLMFCMLPLFSPTSACSNLSRLALDQEEYRGSSLEMVIELVERVLSKMASNKNVEGRNLAVEDDEAGRLHKASQLFLNEVDQLQIQIRHILNIGSRCTFCGNVV